VTNFCINELCLSKMTDFYHLTVLKVEAGSEIQNLYAAEHVV
jgi:hypothetical protein